MLHFRLKKRGEVTPYEKVESLFPADLLGYTEEEAPTVPPWKPVIDTSNLSFAADYSPEDDCSKGEDRGSQLTCVTLESEVLQLLLF